MRSNGRGFNVPIAAVIPAAIMATAGATKITSGVQIISVLVSNDLLVTKQILLALGDVMLGGAVFCVAVALVLRRRWARIPLLVLTATILVIDLAASVDLWPSSTTGDDSVFVHAAIRLVVYVAAAWLLTTRSVTNYLEDTRGSTPHSSA